MKLVKIYGPKKWSNIAKHLPGRIGKQCRERYHQRTYLWFWVASVYFIASSIQNYFLKGLNVKLTIFKLVTCLLASNNMGSFILYFIQCVNYGTCLTTVASNPEIVSSLSCGNDLVFKTRMFSSCTSNSNKHRLVLEKEATEY